jgi:hypothetical protein
VGVGGWVGGCSDDEDGDVDGGWLVRACWLLALVVPLVQAPCALVSALLRACAVVSTFGEEIDCIVRTRLVLLLGPS